MKITIGYPSGRSLYVIALNNANLVFNNDNESWEELSSGSWVSYTTNLTELLAGIYEANITDDPNVVRYCIYRKIGINKSSTDPLCLIGAIEVTAADIADELWDDSLLDHVEPGSAGYALSVAGDPMLARIGTYEEGTAGYEIHDLYTQVTAVLPNYPSIIVPAPPTEEQSTAWIRCLNEYGNPEGGVIIQLRMVRTEEGVHAYDSTIISAVSAEHSGLWTASIPRGSGFVYEARRGNDGRWVRFRGANTETVLLPSVLGQT